MVVVGMERQAVLVALLFVGTKYPSRKKRRKESAVGLWFESKFMTEEKSGQPEPWSRSQVTHVRLPFPISAKIPAHWRCHPHSGTVLLFGDPLIEASLILFSYLVPNTVK